MIDANKTSGTSPGASNDSFVCSGGSPGIGAGFSFSGNSPTSLLVRSFLRAVLAQQFHSENFVAVEVNRQTHVQVRLRITACGAVERAAE